MLMKNFMQRLMVSGILRRRWQRGDADEEPVDWWDVGVGAIYVFLFIAAVRACT